MIKGLISQRNQGRRGSLVVEFALIFILYLLVVLGLMEFGRCMWTYATLAHASRQAARFCMVRGTYNPATTTEIENVVKRFAVGLDDSKLIVNTTYDSTDPDFARGDIIEVEVGYPFQFVTAPITVSGNTLNLSASTEITIAN